MKSLITLVFLFYFIDQFIALKTLNAQIIYGEDNRQWVGPHELSSEKFYNIEATAAIVSKYKMIKTSLVNGFESFIMVGLKYPDYDPQQYSFNDQAPPLDIKTNFCPTKNNYIHDDAQAISSCTSILIDEDKILTAGHCVDLLNSCGEAGNGNMRFVFKFYKNSLFTHEVENSATQQFYLPKKEDIYSCSRVLSYIYDTDAYGLLPSGSLEYAIVELDRKVTGRTPVILNFSKKINPLKLFNEQASIYNLGFPIGYPLSLIDEATVEHVSENYFSSNIDSFKGNSGGGVFKESDNLLMGIVSQIPRIRFSFDFQKECFNTYRCEGGDNCNQKTGVVPITAILNDLKNRNLSLWNHLCQKSKQYYSSDIIECS